MEYFTDWLDIGQYAFGCLERQRHKICAYLTQYTKADIHIAAKVQEFDHAALLDIVGIVVHDLHAIPTAIDGQHTDGADLDARQLGRLHARVAVEHVLLQCV